MKSAYSKFWYFEDSLVVSNGTNTDGSFTITTRFLHVADQSGNGQWWSVGSAHEETLENNFVESCISSSCKESVQLDQKLDIDVFAFGRATKNFTVLVVANIDTLKSKTW